MKNIVFIDGQNLYKETQKINFNIDFKKFYIYLKDKYSVYKIYYFIGYKSDTYKNLYTYLKNSGFELIFKEHTSKSLSYKKGNVDSDIIFEVMKHIVDDTDFDKIVLVSGDGDYIKIVRYLIEKNKLLKILFPNKHNRSSLYKKLHPQYYAFLEKNRTHLEFRNKQK